MPAIEGVAAYQGWSLRGVPLYTRRTGAKEGYCRPAIRYVPHATLWRDQMLGRERWKLFYWMNFLEDCEGINTKIALN